MKKILFYLLLLSPSFSHSYIRQIIVPENVKTYGATGNGSTSDTTAINVAISCVSARGGGILYFPPGVYISTFAIIAKSSVTLMGDDKYASVISLPQSNINPMDFSMIENNGTLSKFSMKNIGIRGNRSFQTTNFTNGSSDGYGVGFFSGPINDVEFDNIYVSSFGSTTFPTSSGGGILIVPVGADSRCNDIRCTNSIFRNNSKIGGFYIDPSEATLGGGKNYYINDNTIYGSGGNNNGLYVLGGYLGAGTSNYFVENVQINRNQFYMEANLDACIEINGVRGFTINENNAVMTSSGVCNFLIRSDVKNGSFSNNNIVSYSSDTTKPSIALVAFSNGEYQDNIVVDGNTVILSTANTNVFKIQKGSRRIKFSNNVVSSTATISPVSSVLGVGEASDVDIFNNTFENITNGIVISDGTFPSTSRIRIKNNSWNNSGGSAAAQISTTGGTISVTYLHVEDNTVTNPKSTSGGAAFASLAVSANTGNIIRNNKVFGGLSVIDSTVPWSSIQNNLGYNPVGPSAITVGASPFTYTAGVTPETVYIQGGTVSNITIGGTSVAVASPSQVQLPSGVAVVVTYTGTPTMVRYIQ